MPRQRKRMCQARMEIVEVRRAEPEIAEIMEFADEMEAPKMIQPKKPKQKEQRLPGVKLLRRINKEHDDEKTMRREEALNRREEALRIREENIEEEEILKSNRKNNIIQESTTNFLNMMKSMRLDKD
mgnify:FL=1|tara:strand:+ start:542 stop:922 length:381 start_codon:yes stop_codon:yes gene_type:complete